jgi:hypothetical protein
LLGLVTNGLTGEFYRRLATEVAAKGEAAAVGVASTRSTAAMYG